MLGREPGVDEAMRMCLEAWAHLSTCRSFGMGAGPIPFTAVLAWAKWKRLDRELTELLVAVIQRLDRDFLESEQSKRALRTPR